MKTLALEFSSARRSVAVAEVIGAPPIRLLAEVADEAGGRPGALAMVEAALAQAGARREEIQWIAIGLGPGSHTGIRAAIALAQGWQLARGVKLLGVGSVDALVRRLWAEGRRGRAHAAVDAQRGDFYLAAYELDDARATLTEPLRIVPREEVEAVLARRQFVAMPEEPAVIPGAQTVFPSAAGIASLAAERSQFVSGEWLAPVCLRAASFVKAPPPRLPAV